MSANKGEWSEVYVLLKLLCDGRMQMYREDGDLERNDDEFMQILQLKRCESQSRSVTYEPDVNGGQINIEVNENIDGINRRQTSEINIDAIGETSRQLLDEIKERGGRSFEVSEAIADFLQRLQIQSSKTYSRDKSDIYMRVRDPRFNVIRDNVGFSIKSKIGKDPTLFNTALASGVIFHLEGCTEEKMANINAILENGKRAVRGRCQRILELDIIPTYVGYEKAKRTNRETFKENLEIINPRLPEVIAKILENYNFGPSQEREEGRNIPSLIGQIVNDNPLNIQNGEAAYPSMFKQFLYAAYCGMTASTPWDGRGTVNGGFITVSEEGDVTAHYALESERFKEYLFQNCYLELPSTAGKHGDYAEVYREDGEYYFKLNFQIRYH